MNVYVNFVRDILQANTKSTIDCHFTISETESKLISKQYKAKAQEVLMEKKISREQAEAIKKIAQSTSFRSEDLDKQEKVPEDRVEYIKKVSSRAMAMLSE